MAPVAHFKKSAVFLKAIHFEDDEINLALNYLKQPQESDTTLFRIPPATEFED